MSEKIITNQKNDNQNFEQLRKHLLPILSGENNQLLERIGNRAGCKVVAVLVPVRKTARPTHGQRVNKFLLSK